MVNILLIGGLSDKKFIDKTKVLLDCTLVKSIYLFRSSGNVYRENIKVKVLPFFNRAINKNKFIRIIFDAYNLLGYSILIVLRKINVLVGIYLYPHGHYASILGFIFHKPVVLILPGTDLKILITSHRYLKLFLNADVICLRGNDSIKKMINMGFDREKLIVLHNVFEISEYSAKPTKSFCYDLIFIGYLRRLKRVDVLLQIVKRLKVEFPCIKCLILGEGSERENLFKMSIEHGLETNVEFSKYINPLQDILNKCKIYVLTSESEGLPMSMIEAMSCGLPAVVSKVNDIPDVVKDGYNGFLVDPLNVDMFAERCSRLLRNEELRKSMGMFARITIEQLYNTDYSFNAVAQTWVRILKKIS